MAGMNTALTGITAARWGLDTTAHNIANANTPGYRRQRVDLAARPATLLKGHQLGGGVEMRGVRQVRDALIESRLLDQRHLEGHLETANSVAAQIEAIFGEPSEFALSGLFEDFFASLDTLAQDPTSTVARDGVLSAANAVGSVLQSIDTQFASLAVDIGAQVEGTLLRVNELTASIAQLNRQIKEVEAVGAPANDSRDARDQAITELQALLQVDVHPQPDATVTVLASGILLVSGGRASALETGFGAGGETILQTTGEAQVTPRSGKLKALWDYSATDLPALRDKLDALAAGLIRECNALHAAGLGARGAFSDLVSARAAADAVTALADAGLDFDVTAGTLYVTVEDLATGDLTRTGVAIDPATHTLTDVAAALTAVAGITAAARSDGTLAIAADSGYAFDFSGRLDPSPDTAGITGTVTPTVSGAWTGGENDLLTFTFDNAGTVGVTDGLTVTVTNAAAETVAVLDVGLGYAAGTEVEVADGVRVAFSPGTAAAADTFAVRGLAEPDGTGVLVALGLNEFFAGTGAGDIAVTDAVAADPTRLAAARSANAGDNTNALRMAGLRDALRMSGGTESLTDFYLDMVTDTASTVRGTDRSLEAQRLVTRNLEEQREGVSGVNVDEEMVNLVKFQYAYAASARVITVMQSTTDDLMSLV
jgi:flagellar hook-associated protein 1 FlgK